MNVVSSVYISVKYWLFIGLFSVAAAAAVAMHKSDQLLLCGEVLLQDPGKLTIYWDDNGDFTNTHSNEVSIQSGSWMNFCQAGPSLKNQKRVRLDPTSNKTSFSLQDIKVTRNNLIYPLGTVFARDLSIDSSIKRNFVSLGPQKGISFRPLNTNPNLTWDVPDGYLDSGPVLIANTLLIIFYLGIISTFLIVLNKRYGSVLTTTRNSIFFALSPLLLFFLFVAFSVASKQFADFSDYWDVSLYYVIVLFFLSHVLRNLLSLSEKFCIYISAGTVIVFLLSFDLIFHFDQSRRSTFSRINTPLYHWKSLRLAEDNISQSSLKYYSDFQEIGNHTRSGARFLSDVATSYYIAAALPLHMTNSLRHHWRPSMLTPAEIDAICHSKDALTMEAVLNRYSSKEIKNSRPPLDYLILNKDNQNRNVRASCLARNWKGIERQLGIFADKAYSGDYLDLFRIAYTPAPK